MTSESTSEIALFSQDDDESLIYYIAGRIELWSRKLARRLNAFDAAAKRLAKALFETVWVHALYGLLDGLSLCYSTVKYCFDLALTNSTLSSMDIMHDWMVSVDGAIIVGICTLALVTYSVLANCFSDSDDEAIRRYIAISWPFVRDALKGLKNAYKGIRSTFQVIKALGGSSLFNPVIIPASLFMGGITVLNHLWNRAMINDRKAMMKFNASLITETLAAEYLTDEQIADIQSQIKSQTLVTRSLALGSAAYSASIYGLYLYMGVLTVCPFAPPVMIAMTAFCSLYFLANLVGRIYDEYDNQRKLMYAAVKVELILLTKKIRQAYVLLRTLKNTNQLEDYEAQLLLIRALEAEFKLKKKEYITLGYPSVLEAMLCGIKHGLAAYSAISGLLFAVATILILTSSTAFPPAFIIICIACLSSGLAFLAAFMAFNVIKTHEQRKQAEAQLQDEHFLEPFALNIEGDATYEALKEQLIEDLQTMTPIEIENRILSGLERDALPQFLFQEWFEFIRSCFSGAGKGSKAVDYLFNFMQQRDDNGHVHDSKIMLWITIGSIAIHFFVLGIRAFAKGIGKLASLEVEIQQHTIQETINELPYDSRVAQCPEAPPLVPLTLYDTDDPDAVELLSPAQGPSHDVLNEVSSENKLVNPVPLRRVNSLPGFFKVVPLEAQDDLVVEEERPSQPSPGLFDMTEETTPMPNADEVDDEPPASRRFCRTRSSPSFFSDYSINPSLDSVNSNLIVSAF